MTTLITTGTSMTNMTIEQKQAYLLQLAAEAQAKLDAEVQSKVLDVQIAAMLDPEQQAYETNLAISKRVTDSLTAMLQICKDLVTREEPKNNINGKLYVFRDYGLSEKRYGTHTNLLTSLIAGLRSMPNDYRKYLLSKVGIPSELYSDIDFALGQTAYYDIDRSELVDGRAGDAVKLRLAVTSLVNKLQLAGLELTVEQADLDSIYSNSVEKAKAAQQEHVEALAKYEETRATRLVM